MSTIIEFRARCPLCNRVYEPTARELGEIPICGYLTTDCCSVAATMETIEVD